MLSSTFENCSVTEAVAAAVATSRMASMAVCWMSLGEGVADQGEEPFINLGLEFLVAGRSGEDRLVSTVLEAWTL
eukprot:27541-Pyramimonas_sp.AAC.1